MAVVAGGLLLVALDFRTRSVDVLPDAVGWVLVATGTWTAGVRRGAPLALAAAALSLAELALPYHFVRYDAVGGTFITVPDPPPGEVVLQRWDDLSLLRGTAIASAMLLGGAAVVVLLHALVRRAQADHDDVGMRELRIAALAPAAWSLAFVAVVAVAAISGERYDPMWDGAGELVWLVAVVALLGLGLFLAARRDRPWAFVAEADGTPALRTSTASRR